MNSSVPETRCSAESTVVYDFQLHYGAVIFQKAQARRLSFSHSCAIASSVVQFLLGIIIVVSITYTCTWIYARMVLVVELARNISSAIFWVAFSNGVLTLFFTILWPKLFLFLFFLCRFCVHLWRMEFGASAVARSHRDSASSIAQSIYLAGYLSQIPQFLGYSRLVFEFRFQSWLVWRSCGNLQQFSLTPPGDEKFSLFWESLTWSKQELFKWKPNIEKKNV